MNNKIIFILILLAFLNMNIFINVDAKSTNELSKYDLAYKNGDYRFIIINLAPIVHNYEIGKESFLTKNTINHAGNLVADSYRMLEKYSHAGIWYAANIDGYDDQHSAYCFEVFRQISIINGRTLELSPERRYLYTGMTIPGKILLKLMDDTSLEEKRKYFHELVPYYKKNNWEKILLKYCANETKYEDLWKLVPKECNNIVNTYVGLNLEISGRKEEARQLYWKALTQKGSPNIEALLALNRLGLFALKIIYTNSGPINRLTTIYSNKVSSIKLENGTLYSVKNLIDNDPKTAWVPDSKKSGIGEWVELSFDDPTPIDSLNIINGYVKSDLVFQNNNRVKIATLEFSDGSKEKILLKDTMEPQSIPIGKTTQKIRLYIDEVYKGTKYDDTCLSEIEVKFDIPDEEEE